jgi:membrane protein implicated in regulation of membrane protease activity
LVDALAISVLAASLLVPRYRGERWHWPVGLGALLAYFSYGYFSVLISEPKVFGIFELSKIARGILFFTASASYIRTRREIPWLVGGVILAIAWQGMYVAKQRLIYGMERVEGSLDHANSLSMYLCLVGPVLMAAACCGYSKWFGRACLGALAVAAICCVLTLSRAGVPIFVFVVGCTAAWCVRWRITPRKLKLGFVVMLFAGVFLYMSWKPLMERYGSASLQEEYLDEDVGVEGRGVYLRWAKMIVADHFFGLGLNNWSYGVSKTYGIKQGFIYGDYDSFHDGRELQKMPEVNFAAPAHSLGALTLGELGIPGLALFIVIWLRWFYIGSQFLRRKNPDPMFRMGVGFFFAICGIFLQSLTEWVYRQTPMVITFNVFLGAIAGLCYYWRPKRVAPAAIEPVENPAIQEMAGAA